MPTSQNRDMGHPADCQLFNQTTSYKCNRRSFDFASRDDAARGSAQDDSVLVVVIGLSCSLAEVMDIG